MAACGFYRGSGAAWQRALPPELEKIEDGSAVRQRCWELLVLDREGARRLSGQGRKTAGYHLTGAQRLLPRILRKQQRPAQRHPALTT